MRGRFQQNCYLAFCSRSADAFEQRDAFSKLEQPYHHGFS